MVAASSAGFLFLGGWGVVSACCSGLVLLTNVSCYEHSDVG